ncbi:MAG: 50S ribosomal protein L5 [Chloroflexi bacterium]|nr:50S ribosomal protein L5 [Chloroflexota bacterium]
MTSRLQERYEEEIVAALQREFEYRNVMQVPRLHKVVLNIGLGEAVREPKTMDAAVHDLSVISGQRPIVTKARKSIAGFRLRTGMPIGATVTLRGDRMYEFLDRLVSIGLPRVRDFRGISDRAFDGRGNCTIGLREQLIFPEIEYDKIDRVRGMEVTVVTSARTDEEGKRLLELLGVPFERAAA